MTHTRCQRANLLASALIALMVNLPFLVSALPRWVTVPVANITKSFSVETINYSHVDGHHNAYVVITTEPFSVEMPRGTSSSLATTSVQARDKRCHAAMNGGPFQANGDAVGGVIIDGNLVFPMDSDLVGFGLTRGRDDTPKWVLGQIANASEAENLQLQYFVTGFNWLVYQGQITPSSNPTGAERAPRSAIGVDQQGRLLLVVVDGCELCLRHKGLTLEEMAQLMINVGAYHAINLDGGSSSTMVVNGKVRNQPTCWDIPLICERPVATIVCIRSPTNADIA